MNNLAVFISNMPYYVTTIQAKDPVTGKEKKFYGPYILARTWDQAHAFCQNNGLGFCTIDGELVAEVEADEKGAAIWSSLRAFSPW